MSLILPILVLSGIGAVMGAGLAVAAKFLSVEEDPRVEALMEILPSANCGACGYPGCSGYAKELVAGVDIGLCSPGGSDTVAKIASILGVEAVEMVPKTALVRCAGGRDVAPDRSFYMGPSSCKAAVSVSAGPKECRWGCVGLGDCADVCEDNAIDFTEDGLAFVRAELCIACARCVKACPRDLIEMVPTERKVHVLCSSQDPGKSTKAVCQVGCIACKLCARRDKDSFIVENNNARVLYGEGSKDTPVAALVCTPGAIWDANEDDLVSWLTEPSRREALKERQAELKAKERAERAAKKKAAAAAKKAKADKPKAEQAGSAVEDKPTPEETRPAKADKPDTQKGGQ